MAKITYVGSRCNTRKVYGEINVAFVSDYVVEYDTGTTRTYKIERLPKKAVAWMEENTPEAMDFYNEEIKEYNKAINPFGIEACMDSVMFHVETLKEDPFEMLAEFEQRAKEDVLFNETMIEAVKQYIAENGLTQEEKKGAKEMTREEKSNTIKAVEENTKAVIGAYQETDKPSETVERLVESMGYENAVVAVATIVNRVSVHDGRIYDGVREWAKGIEDAPSNDVMVSLGIYGVDSWIHSAHVNQIGEAMRDYEPKEEEPSLSTYPLTDLGEVLETLDENKTVVVYANGSANAPEVARYDGRNSIPTELNSARVHHYAQDVNAYYVYLEEMPTEPRTVDTCDLIHDIKNELGDDAPTDISHICDYSETAYISDIFAEWADSETSIYYHDIIKYISEHVDAVNCAIEEMGWEGCGSNLYNAGQMAEYLEINNWLWEHETEAYKVYALNWFRFEYMEEVTKNTPIRVDTWERFCDELRNYGQCDRLGDVIEIMKQTIEAMEEREVA